MKIVTEPTVTVFSSQVFHGVPNYGIPVDGDEPTMIGAFAAKTCYRSFGVDGRANALNQEKIIESGHGRILEHMVFGLHITGISRALSLELLTHVIGISKSQESTRYVDMADAGIVLEPYLAGLWEKYHGRWGDEENGFLYFDDPDSEPPIREELELVSRHVSSAYNDFLSYEYQLERLMRLNPLGLSGTELRKWARGKARNSLPHNLETRMVLTGNLRAWRHFIEMRSDRYAEDEIRRLAHHVFQALQPLAPLYFQDYTTEIIRGIPEYQTPHRKV